MDAPSWDEDTEALDEGPAVGKRASHASLSQAESWVQWSEEPHLDNCVCQLDVGK